MGLVDVKGLLLVSQEHGVLAADRLLADTGSGSSPLHTSLDSSSEVRASAMLRQVTSMLCSCAGGGGSGDTLGPR